MFIGLKLKYSISIFLLISVTFFYSSCVSKKKYLSSQTEVEDLKDKNESLQLELSLSKSQIIEQEINREKLERDIEILKTNMIQQLEKKQQELIAKEEKLNELEDIIFKLNTQVQQIKSAVSTQLQNYQEDDVMLSVKDGKLYISLSEKLLFKSGSYKLDPTGAEVVALMSSVLINYPDISITIEGNTDNVGSEISNWDLSVLRATSIIHVMTLNKISPSCLNASGKGSFSPVSTNDTEEGREKNRRTEIIISPNLQDFFEILNEQTK
jgi:chemotaxis protein MotB